MATVKIEDRDYELDHLSEEAQRQIASIQFVETELQRLNSQTAVLKTARETYIAALKAQLPKD